jgi:drug/metabolite transporter (DMT)-like permease
MEQPTKNPLPARQVGMFALVVGILCLLVAGVFGAAQTVRVSLPREQAYTDAPNTTAAGAACGFAIAGGLCFVAAAIAVSGGREPGPSRQTNDEPGTPAVRPSE